MSKIKLLDGNTVEEYAKPYFIAEVNSSHNGNIDMAMQMIDCAVEAGCDCVKFQSWSSQTLYSQSYYKKNPIAKRFVDKFSVSSENLKKMALFCNEKKIAFSSTPYSKEEVDFLVDECKVPFIKISSMEVNNLKYLAYIAKKKTPIVLSTGMSHLEEIQHAVEVIEQAGNHNIALLHCVSIYPTRIDMVDLNNILMLREKFPNYPIGFSDHTIGDVAAIGATTLGAAIIEKHLTLDSGKIGMDNQMAMEPKELKDLISRCIDINSALGSRFRVIKDDEMKQREAMRRSIVSTRPLDVGHILSYEDMDVKRPGTGLPPKMIDELIGRVVKNHIDGDSLILQEDLMNLKD